MGINVGSNGLPVQLHPPASPDSTSTTGTPCAMLTFTFALGYPPPISSAFRLQSPTQSRSSLGSPVCHSDTPSVRTLLVVSSSQASRALLAPNAVSFGNSAVRTACLPNTSGQVQVLINETCASGLLTPPPPHVGTQAKPCLSS